MTNAVDPDPPLIPTCPGILQALSDANRKGIVIISVDGSHIAVDLLAAGQIYGAMAQFPQKIGSLAVENLGSVIEKKSAGNSIPKIIDSGTTRYSKDNLDEARKQMHLAERFC